jgi:hypothetical protein
VRPHPSVAPRHAGATSRDHGSSRSFADVASDSLVPVSCNIQTPTMRLFAVAAACPPEFESYSKRRCSPISFLRKLTVPLPLARKPSNFFFFYFCSDVYHTCFFGFNGSNVWELLSSAHVLRQHCASCISPIRLHVGRRQG